MIGDALEFFRLDEEMLIMCGIIAVAEHSALQRRLLGCGAGARI